MRLVLCLALALLSTSCQQSEPKSDAGLSEPLTELSKAGTEAKEAPNPATTGSPAVPVDAYFGDDFAIESPERWETIDERSVADGSAAEKLPTNSDRELFAQLTNAFEGGAIVSFYDFGDAEAQYTPNITLSRKGSQRQVSASTLAVQTEASLREAGLGEVTYRLGENHLGALIVFTYTVPDREGRASGDLFGTSHVIFGENATWVLSGLTLHSPESIERAVATTASSLVEL